MTPEERLLHDQNIENRLRALEKRMRDPIVDRKILLLEKKVARLEAALRKLDSVEVEEINADEIEVSGVPYKVSLSEIGEKKRRS